MHLDYIRNNAIIFQELVWRPLLVPVDYCGTLVYNVSITLADGTSISRSSFEIPEGGDEDTRCAATIALLAERVAERNVRPRSDFLDAPLTKAYRSLCGLSQPDWAVSACLCGERCRYDGGDNRCAEAVRLLEAGQAIPVCPELLGGLPVPRDPCEIRAGQVVTQDGEDHTAAFARGVRRAMKTVREWNCIHALLKERSPSCGVRRIYDGSFSGVKIAGAGLFARALGDAGLTLATEEDFQ